MQIIDISWPISEKTTEYKNKKTIKIIKQSEFDSDGSREKLITFSSHTGTHIDAPAHFLKNGKTLDQLNINKFYGLCKILDLTHIKEKITKKNLENFNIKKKDIIIIKTKNSDITNEDKFIYNYVYLEKTGAKYLVSKKIKTFGFDYLGIERNQINHETHKYLLEAEIPIIEGLRLKNIPPGTYTLSCFPIFIKNADAAPARAILIKK